MKKPSMIMRDMETVATVAEGTVVGMVAAIVADTVVVTAVTAIKIAES